MKKDAIIRLLQDARDEQDAIKILTANEPTPRDHALFYAGQHFKDAKGEPIKFDHDAESIAQSLGIPKERHHELMDLAITALTEAKEQETEDNRMKRSNEVEIVYQVAANTAEFACILLNLIR